MAHDGSVVPLQSFGQTSEYEQVDEQVAASSTSSSSDDSENSWASARPTIIVDKRTSVMMVSDEENAPESSSSSEDEAADDDGKAGEQTDAAVATTIAVEDHLGNVVMQKVETKTPSWLINIYSYCILVSVIEFWYYFYLAYQVAVMTSIEKRYGWPSIYSGFFLASFEIGHVTIIIFSFTETNINIPRRLAVRGFFMAFGSLLSAAPHFLITVPGDALRKEQRNNMLNQTLQIELLDCFKSSNSCNSSSSSSLDGVTSVAEGEDTSAVMALVLLIIAQVVVATASSTYHVIGVIYIDNNVEKAKSSTLIGVVYSMMMLGPAAAFFFSSWVAGSVYVYPSDPSPPASQSADFVGAWWIGFVVCSGMFALVAPFLFLFPKKLETKHHHHHHHHHHHRHNHKQTEKLHPSDEHSSRSLIRSKDDPDKIDGENFTIKSLPRNFVMLFRNTTFIALVLVNCMQIYFLAGYFTFFPKYLESKFLQTTQVANFVSGIANPVPCALGTFLGGWLMAKLKLSKAASLMYSFVFTLLVAIGMLLMMLMQCEQSPILGLANQGNASEFCGCQNCPTAFLPVCTTDSRTFMSPCLAGCQRFDPFNKTYTSCGCPLMGNNDSDLLYLSAVPGRCEEVGESSTGSSSRCANFYLYNIFAFILAVIIFIPQTPLMIIMMRVVGERYKSWAVGLTSSFCSFLGFIPGPVLYGAAFDAQCLLWEDMSPEKATDSCQANSGTPKNDGPKYCKVYDTDSLAIWFHGLTSLFLFLSLPMNIYAWWKCREQEKAEALLELDEERTTNKTDELAPSSASVSEPCSSRRHSSSKPE